MGGKTRQDSLLIPQPLIWEGDWQGRLRLLDQRLLPKRECYLNLTSLEEVRKAILELAVRGAPAIGIAAAYGAVLAWQKAKEVPKRDWKSFWREVVETLKNTRPTAVNLFWALERQSQVFSKHCQASWEEVGEALFHSAKAIHEEDKEMCRRIGEWGASLLPEVGSLLTHCNTGALATGGIGTALGIIYTAFQKGKKLHVFVDETRPLLQGGRLTAWELQRAGIPLTLICDNMAGFLMKQGKIKAVLVGADRIAKNGDVANKIGTYPLACLARFHNVPFYVAAPSSTFDLSLSSGDAIPIEERKPEEVTQIQRVPTAPEGVEVWNPAFDVTPAELVTAIVTEKGILRPVTEEKVCALLA